MSEHNFCRHILKSARDDFKKKYKQHLRLDVSQFKISPTYSDYEVRLTHQTTGQNFNKVIATSTCCSYDAKTKALTEFLDEEGEFFNKLDKFGDIVESTETCQHCKGSNAKLYGNALICDDCWDKHFQDDKLIGPRKVKK